MSKFIIKIFYYCQSKIEKIFLFIILKIEKVEYYNISIFQGVPYILNKGKLIIEENTIINSKYRHNPIGGNTFSSFWIKKGAKIIIKEGARISNSAFVSSQEIIIGKNVYIGGDCKIYDTDFHSLKLERRMEKIDNDVKSSRVLINDGVFIGTGTIILKGVIIGDNSIIGAGSVVVKDIPANEIWGGNPAQYIRKIIK